MIYFKQWLTFLNNYLTGFLIQYHMLFKKKSFTLQIQILRNVEDAVFLHRSLLLDEELIPPAAIRVWLLKAHTGFPLWEFCPPLNCLSYSYAPFLSSWRTKSLGSILKAHPTPEPSEVAWGLCGNLFCFPPSQRLFPTPPNKLVHQSPSQS